MAGLFASLLSPARWALISPRLDELLELEAAARTARLAQWRADDPQLASELQKLLDGSAALDGQQFLNSAALAATLAGAATGNMPHEGMLCGAWVLERSLGSGGMGSVWLARRADGRYEAEAAVKLPHPGVLGRGGAERFEREGRLLARLSHPRIAALLDAGVTAAAQPYLVLEYVRGEAIDRWCDGRRSSVEARIDLCIDVLDAVAHAHNQLVLHRDLKPANILVTAEGQVKLLDFGIAKLIEAQTAESALTAPAQTMRLFTPDHAAPEQLQGEGATTATDVYAIGVLLYQLLCGGHPTSLPTQTPIERLRAIVENEPPRLSDAAARSDSAVCALRAGASPQRLARMLRGDLDTIVAKALRKPAHERYPNAAALADDLRRWRAGLPVYARPQSWHYRVGRFVLRHRLGVGAAALGAALLIGGIFGTTWQAAAARRERDEARWQAERALARGNLFNLLLGEMGTLDAPLTQRQLLERAVKLVESSFAGQPKLAVELLLPVAGQFHTLGDHAADLVVMQRAAALAQASGDPSLEALAACSTVDTYIALRRTEDARAALARAASALASLPPSPVLQASCWKYEAQLEFETGNVASALALGQRAMQLLESSGQTRGNAYPSHLSFMVELLRENSDFGGALGLLERQQELLRRGGRDGSTEALETVRKRAHLLRDRGEMMAAHGLLVDAMSRWGAAPFRGAPAHWLLSLGELQLRLGDVSAAQTSVDRVALQSVAASPFSTGVSVLRARIALAQGRLDDASRAIDQADAHAAAETPMRSLAAERAGLRAELMAARGDTVAAQQASEARLAQLERTPQGNLARRAEAWRDAGTIAMAAGDAARAATHAQAALGAALKAEREPGTSADVGHAQLLLASAHSARGDAQAARAQAQQALRGLSHGLGSAHPLSLEAQRLTQR